MITISGKSVFGGVSIGKLMFYKRSEKTIKRTHVDDVDAAKAVLRGLKSRKEKTGKTGIYIHTVSFSFS